MAHKTFSAKPLPETVTVTFDGPRSKPDPEQGDRWEETFETVPGVPFETLRLVAGAVDVNDRGDTVYDMDVITTFWEGVLYDEDVARFRRLVADKHRLVDIEQLGDAMQFVAGELLGRPTGPSPT